MRASPSGRVILLGAAGTTGRLTASAMVRQGLRPVLAGPDEEGLAAMAEDLAPDLPAGHALEVAQVDSTDPASIRSLVASTADVLVSTVGPFTTQGEAPVQAAVDAGCGYLDCAWEPPFLRRVYEEFGPSAAQSGALLLPSLGCYYVAGSLASTIALRRTMTGSRAPARVDIGYFNTGSAKSGIPGDALIEESFRWTGGRLRPERPGARVRTFEIGASKHADALSLGSAEHFTVPRLAASVTDVNVYVGWFGRLTRAAAVAGTVGGTASRVLGMGSVWDSMVRGFGTVGGGDGSADPNNPQHRTVVVAETYDADGALQQRVRVEGPGPHMLTAALLSWGAGMLLQGAASGTGALGPAEAFGTEALISGCLALGLAEVHNRY